MLLAGLVIKPVNRNVSSLTAGSSIGADHPLGKYITMLKLTATNRGEATLSATSSWAAAARGASLRYTRRTPIRGVAPHPWGGPKRRSRCAFEGGWTRRCHPAPPPWPLQLCTTAGQRSGGGGVWYVLFHTSLSLWKVPPVSPANLPRVTGRWHRSRWERGGGGETRKLTLRSLRSPWFLFLVPLLMTSLQSPHKILSSLNY